MWISAPEVQAETFRLPGIGADRPQKLELGPCENIPGSQDNCVRALACMGRDGVWFDGQALGWDAGDIVGQLSTGEACIGTWRAQAVAGMGLVTMTCEGGLTARLLYHSFDSETGTAEGTGIDSKGRRIRGWSGLAVLDYLEKTTGKVATLPCGGGDGSGDVPIS